MQVLIFKRLAELAEPAEPQNPFVPIELSDILYISVKIR
jgi:hypothetical protein